MPARRLLAIAASFAVIAVSAIVPAGSAGAATDTGTELFPGWKFSGATITSPGKPPRHLSSSHTVAFVQSWYVATIISATTSLVEEHPPASLPVFTVKANDTVTGEPYTFIAYYVTNGKKAWVGLPKQTIGPGAFVPKEKWWIAPPRATPAFQGKLEPDLPAATGTTTSTTSPPAKVAESKSSSNSAAVIIAVVAGVALLGVGAVVVRSRRKADAT